MVSNYDRILTEITNEANRTGCDLDIPAERLIELVMEIVDAEDRHRIKQFPVNKEIENMITTTATSLKKY
ncbi:MAG: hypothetical protein OXE93_06905 [bacterium]|nr:hypothetical protein [bacterium]